MILLQFFNCITVLNYFYCCLIIEVVDLWNLQVVVLFWILLLCVTLCCTVLCFVVLCCFALCCVVLCCFVLCCVMLCWCILCCVCCRQRTEKIILIIVLKDPVWGNFQHDNIAEQSCYQSMQLCFVFHFAIKVRNKRLVN